MNEHRRSVDHDIRPAIGTLRVDKLTGSRLDHLHADLLARGLSPASVRRRHAVIHAALDRAVKWGVIAANPADRATPPGRPPSTDSAPAVDVVQQFIGAAERQGNAVLAMAVALGSRHGCPARGVVRSAVE